MSYNPKKIAIIINGLAMQMLGADLPTIARSGAYFETKSGVNGDMHNLERHDVWYILTLVLKYDSPNIDVLENLAKNHTEFAASYKDGNTGRVYNTVKGVCAEIGEAQGDNDRTFTINFIP